MGTYTPKIWCGHVFIEIFMYFQEHASSNPGLQAFLEKKSDEHMYSALYLLAGVFCLYAAFFHGENFCTLEPPAGVQVRMLPPRACMFLVCCLLIETER
jgi:hypothetical protein